MSRDTVLSALFASWAMFGPAEAHQSPQPVNGPRQAVEGVDRIPDGPMLELFPPVKIGTEEIEFLAWLASENEEIRDLIRAWQRTAHADYGAWRAESHAALVRTSREIVKSHGATPSLEGADAIARLFTDRDRAARVLFDRERVSLASHLADAGVAEAETAEVLSIVALARRSGAVTGLEMWAPPSRADPPRLLFAASRGLSDECDEALRRCLLEAAPRLMEARISYADACVGSVPRGAREVALEASGEQAGSASPSFRTIAIAWRRLASLNTDLLDACLSDQPEGIHDRLRTRVLEALYGPLATGPYELGPLQAELSRIHPSLADSIAELCAEWVPRRHADRAKVLAAFDAATSAFLERGLSPDRDAGRRFMSALEVWLSESTSASDGASARLMALFEERADAEEASARAREAILRWREAGARATERIAASQEVQMIVPAIRRWRRGVPSPSP